jgi:uncharacterized membrane protein HdeD (DUF308 family)
MATGSWLQMRLDEELRALRGSWGWFVALGVLLIIAGILAITYPVIATLATVEVVGAFLVVGAAFEIASGIWARQWGGFFLHLLGGLLYFFVGIILIERPGLGAAGYTLMMSVFFVAGGLVRIISALLHRFPAWFWSLLSGLVALALGILIWRDFPASALWVIGVFVGIDLLFVGWSWVMLGFSVRRAPPSPPV